VTAQQAQTGLPALSRQQRFLRDAAANVQAVKGEQRHYAQWHDYKEIYGGLCHKVPVLIMTNGLCQTVAFIEAKASGDGDKPRPRAYQTLRRHLAGALGQEAGTLAAHVQGLPVGDYIRATRTVLGAWAYYKRFAESMLGVQPGMEADNAGAPE